MNVLSKFTASRNEATSYCSICNFCAWYPRLIPHQYGNKDLSKCSIAGWTTSTNYSKGLSIPFPVICDKFRMSESVTQLIEALHIVYSQQIALEVRD